MRISYTPFVFFACLVFLVGCTQPATYNEVWETGWESSPFFAISEVDP